MDIPIEIDVTTPHDIGIEIKTSQGESSFFTLIPKGTSYPLAKKAHIFTLAGENEADMTTASLEVLERVNPLDKFHQCLKVGRINISGLPPRPSGKTNLKLTLSIEEKTRTLKGNIEDMGYGSQYKKSGFKKDFELNRNNTTYLEV